MEIAHRIDRCEWWGK